MNLKRLAVLLIAMLFPVWREVQPGELSVILLCSFIVGACGLFWRVVAAEHNLDPTVLDLRSPSAADARNSLKTTGIVSRFPSIALILRGGRFSQITAAIIQAVAVYMVRAFSRPRPRKNGMHKNGFSASVPLRVELPAGRMLPGAPVRLRQCLKVSGVHDGDMAIGKRYKANCGIYWLNYWLPGFPGKHGLDFIAISLIVLGILTVPGASGQGQNFPGNTSSSSPTSSLVQSGLLADYLLIDGSGTTIKDSSAAGNNGTFCAGNPTWGASPSFGLTFTAASSQCVVLPAALNAARTFFFYVDTTAGVGNFNAFVAGTVGGSSAAIWYDAAPGQNQGNGFVSTSSSGGATKDFVPITGPGLIAVTFDTVDHHWVNSLEVPNYQNSGTSAGQQSSGVYQLGGSASGLGGATFCNCKIYRFAVYNRVLTAAEMAQNLTVIQSQQAARGLVTNFNSKAVTDQVIAVGNSETAGTGVTTPWPAQMVIGNGAWTVLNAGSSGRTMAGFAKGEVQENLPLLHPTPARNMEIILAGTNDIFFGTTPALTEQSMESFNTLLQAQRVPTVMCTMIDRTGLSANKNALNTVVRQYVTVFANELCDFAAVPSLGADGANASVLFFIGDGVHPNQNAHSNIMAPMGQASLNHIHGNRDQSTATVYAAPAAAAVATTAGSEATNTVTITTAATPANCNVGNLVFVTGVTPAGYNTTVGNGFGLGGANILTRSATQITYYNNTTGLGAVSVQGTIVCPQQQDNDVYTVLNFGAGNYTLQSCLPWMGRPISIKNINGVASTVVPWLGLTEQIDGAANATVAAGATLILWPRLVSAAAGGCNWFREQNN